MSLLTIKEGLKTRLETIDALKGKVYSFVPGTQEPPSVTIIPGVFVPGDAKPAITYSRHFGGGDQAYVFTLQLVVSRASDRQAILDLDEFISPSGPKSIKAAIEGDDTLGGAVSFAHVERVIQYGVLTWNQLQFFGAQIIVEASGP